MDWGLGHASRCIPIIDELLRLEQRVLLAASGRALHLWKREYPNLPLFPLAEHNIRYFSSNMGLNIAMQWPKIIRAIWKDRKLIADIVAAQKIDVIISDNRFGCYHASVHSIFMTHQLHLNVPKIVQWMNPLINHALIYQFDECWIPDVEREPSLAGKLSHPVLQLPTNYLGILSKMKKEVQAKKYDFLILLSGPEPQRTKLEKKLIDQIHLLKGKILIVQGLAEKEKYQKLSNQIEMVSFLKGKDLARAMQASEYIICRSGYSTVMDLIAIEKTALFIPTPGQTEQEYLAQQLQASGHFATQKQKDLNLREIEQVFPKKVDFSHLKKTNQLKLVIKQLLLRI